MDGLQGVHTQRGPRSYHPPAHAAKVTLPFGGSPTGGDRIRAGHERGEDCQAGRDAEEPAKRLAQDVELFVKGRVVLCRLGKTHVGYLAIFVEHL